MILYPAIDLKGGQAVRLRRGEMDSATVFNADPAAQARLAHQFPPDAIIETSLEKRVGRR